MKKIEGNKLVALLISAGMVTTLLAACTINTDELGKGIRQVGEAFTSATDPEPEISETDDEDETTESEAPSETTEATTEPSTPTPTPLPQRVDFSEYTDVQINDTFTVTVEDFSESGYKEGTDVLLAKFEGNRFVVTKAANDTVRDSINLIVSSFYDEAVSVYNRAYAKALAEYDLKGVVENTYNLVVDFRYVTNGRALSVLMVYELSGAEDKTVVDFASFDMISGQYITFNTVCKDPAGLENALRKGLANSLLIQPKPTETEATTDAEETVQAEAPAEAANLPSAEDFEAIYICPGPATTDAQTNSFATVYGVVDGKVYSAVVDMNAYADFFNRYGASLFNV